MARSACVVAPGIPHHVIQRGNRRQPTFFRNADYQLYLDLALEWSQVHSIQVWSYCLMPNHVHLIVVPEKEASLAAGIGEIHRRYSRAINFRKGWRRHLWQGRFRSFPMDEDYLFAVARYIELNPVRAGLVDIPSDYPWNSAGHFLGYAESPLVVKSPLKNLIENWHDFLSSPEEACRQEDIRKAERTGRPLGGEGFIHELEKMLGRRLGKEKPGPKRKN